MGLEVGHKEILNNTTMKIELIANAQPTQDHDIEILNSHSVGIFIMTLEVIRTTSCPCKLHCSLGIINDIS